MELLFNTSPRVIHDISNPLTPTIGLFPPLPEKIRDKQEKRKRIQQRAANEFTGWMKQYGHS